MAIKETPQPIEFTWDMSEEMEEGGDQIEFAISYDPNEALFPLSITRGDRTQKYPVNLLRDVVEFLQRKGIIEGPPQNYMDAARSTMGPVAQSLLPKTQTVTSAPAPQPTGGGIPLPSIQRIDGSAAVPVTSFDVRTPVTPAAAAPVPQPQQPMKPSANGGPVLTPPQITKSATVNSPQAPTSPEIPSAGVTISMDDGPPVALSADGEIPPEVMREMKSRSVIRFSEAGRKDVDVAIREADFARQASGKGADKVIKKAHR